MIYGFVSTIEKQPREKQKQHIKNLNEAAEIVCGNRKKWEDLIKKINPGDIIIFDSIDVLGQSAEECYYVYCRLLNKNTSLMFCRQPHLNSAVFTDTALKECDMEYALKVIEEQINICFQRNNNISAGIKEAQKQKKINSSKQIGRETGRVYESKKSKKYRKIIAEESLSFGGTKSDKQLIEITGLSRNTIKKYKKQIEEEKNTIDGFRGEEYFFLSNFFPHPITWRGLTFTCSEGAYQAAKAVSRTEMEKFCTLDGTDAKALGKKIVMREDWDDIKLSVMKEILEIKFSDEQLKQKLCDTGNLILVEKNTWKDRYWGYYKGKGENHLGIILMELREKFRNNCI